MSMKKWTDEELASTRDKLDAWNSRHSSSGWGPKLWLLTAFLGAFAISTGFAFIFFDGVTALSIILMVLGSVTCFSWYKSEKQRKDNITFLAEINKEIDHRRKRTEPKSKTKNNEDTKIDKKTENESSQ
ncbi:hypothetical protein SAMN05216419_104812 [Nitrosomonas cryotolerans]|uniref:Uncharacterized protein n=1 Tax=Nitrosomonas cryotolerans ATCC 49181 TaxID=1131553 RepID=A0A1N6J9F1_9PROT|nr:ATP synthase subunit I [Nitrosomonas cryotolerans]SFQ03004.1 hypothetical protein SAMN05216419_104812 [Nitrosomonas cryotolerans]SIO41008.1 hypothetical protein SAMN02743940_2426 [Nitrosomonas cryotolerans ATCC 49181]